MNICACHSPWSASHHATVSIWLCICCVFARRPKTQCILRICYPHPVYFPSRPLMPCSGGLLGGLVALFPVRRSRETTVDRGWSAGQDIRSKGYHGRACMAHALHDPQSAGSSTGERAPSGLQNTLACTSSSAPQNGERLLAQREHVVPPPSAQHRCWAPSFASLRPGRPPP